jgi:hypothetical protein
MGSHHPKAVKVASVLCRLTAAQIRGDIRSVVYDNDCHDIFYGLANSIYLPIICSRELIPGALLHKGGKTLISHHRVEEMLHRGLLPGTNAGECPCALERRSCRKVATPAIPLWTHTVRCNAVVLLLRRAVSWAEQSRHRTMRRTGTGDRISQSAGRDFAPHHLGTAVSYHAHEADCCLQRSLGRPCGSKSPYRHQDQTRADILVLALVMESPGSYVRTPGLLLVVTSPPPSQLTSRRSWEDR